MPTTEQPEFFVTHNETINFYDNFVFEDYINKVGMMTPEILIFIGLLKHFYNLSDVFFLLLFVGLFFLVVLQHLSHELIGHYTNESSHLCLIENLYFMPGQSDPMLCGNSSDSRYVNTTAVSPEACNNCNSM